MKKYKTVRFFKYDVFNDKLNILNNGNRLIINTINPHSYVVAEKDVLFKRALMDSDILLPDGVGITKGVLLLNGRRINRITGMDIHNYLIDMANIKGLRCFYLGSSQETLEKIRERIHAERPNTQVDYFSPSFSEEFDEEENNLMMKKINDFKPDILFVGMTAPKQEKWVHQHKTMLNANIIASIGAVFDFYAGTIKRPGKFWQNIGLEWFPRFLREPKRLWRRVFVSDTLFIIDVIKNKFNNGK